jgi:hypothetical protein
MGCRHHHASFAPVEGVRLPELRDLEHAAEILNAGSRVAILAARGALDARAELLETATDNQGALAMRSSKRISSLARVFLSLPLALPALAQQPDPLTDFQVTGYVYEPQAVPPTDERIAGLKLPAGFSISRAEGLFSPVKLPAQAATKSRATSRGLIFATQPSSRRGNIEHFRD